MTIKKTIVKAKVPVKTDKAITEQIAKVALMPCTNAAAVVAEYSKVFGEQDVQALMEQLRPHMISVNNGDLDHCEAMLVGQAHALQSIFMNLSRRAVSQEYLKQYEMYLRLALKAQNQSRMTLETLAKIKNPPVVFAKQANINQGSGNQQVNNGTPAPAPHTEKTINQQNELLEVNNGSETVDSRATGTAISKDKAMATVG
ncbi:hypothetical protein [Candidatus Nitrotoga arctica]|uniref:Phasin protein n=1 Tax=Candidatus Nitrotoga arctica TaxID=453162 RepID=A0ABN8AFP6_9PROT|nr:hypothetical protein [Candidatus Nitrotoga arctica]CAG9931545.1 conserved protein of unknown function [Candidatus Nitrotoga arctica]